MKTARKKFRFSYRQLVDLALIGLVLAFALWFTGAESRDGGQAYDWEWSRLWQFFVWRDEAGTLHSGLLLQGLFTTLRVGLWSMLLAALLGVCFGFMRGSSSLFLRLISRTYVGTVRNIPPLVLVFVIHFFVGMLFEPYIPWGEIQNALRDAPLAGIFLPLNANLGFFCSAVLAMGLYEGAYTTEVVRAGLESVPRGQWEAARSMGFPRRSMLLFIILPQAFRLMLPPLVNQSVTLVKDSSIVSTISVAELTYQGREIMNTTFMVFEIWTAITLIYLAVSLVISGLGLFLERRIKWRLV